MPLLQEARSLLFTGAWTAGWASLAMVEHAATHDTAGFRRRQRTWAEVLARGWGMQVEAFGAEALDPDGTYLFMANHQSHVDIVALFLGLPVIPGFLAKKELQRVPILGRAMERGGHVFIDRKNRGAALGAIDTAADQVRAGASIVVFPEGTRASVREILPLKKGGFHLAQKAGVPLVPVGLRRTALVLPKHARDVRPGRVEVHVGTPITGTALTDAPLAELMDRVRSELAALSAMPLAPAGSRRA